MDGGEEVSCGFVVAGGDSAKEFELGEEILDQMSSLVEFFVVCALLFAVGLGRNHGCFTCIRKPVQYPLIGIESFVRQQDSGFKLWQQDVGPLQIAGLSAGEMKSDGVAEGIDNGVNLGAQPPFATSNGLVAAPFFSAPALC